MTNSSSYDRGWNIAYWVLLACWVTGAALTMYGVHGGFLTNYLSDLTFPPWFYIALRGLVPRRTVVPFIRWFGKTPGRAAVSIFLVGLVSEVSQKFWPQGLFRGRYDILDIVAYAIGLLACLTAEKFLDRVGQDSDTKARMMGHRDSDQ